jgi:hypothetical protein
VLGASSVRAGALVLREPRPLTMMGAQAELTSHLGAVVADTTGGEEVAMGVAAVVAGSHIEGPRGGMTKGTPTLWLFLTTSSSLKGTGVSTI